MGVPYTLLNVTCHNNFAKSDKLRLAAVSYPVTRVRARVRVRVRVRRTLMVGTISSRPYIAYDVTQLSLYGTHTLTIMVCNQISAVKNKWFQVTHLNSFTRAE